MILFEQLGGEPAMEAAVEIFYRKILCDERVSHFFDDIDMASQRAKQKAFLTMVCGGPHLYTGRDMRKAHAPLVAQGLDDSHVTLVVQYLGETLAELGVKAELIEKVRAIAEGARKDVLNR